MGWRLALYTLCYIAFAGSVLAQGTNDTTNDTTTQFIDPTTAAQTVPQTFAPLPNPTVIERNQDLAVCTCDLTSSFCDIDCCCDADCSDLDLTVFPACTTDSATTSQNTQYCVADTTLFRDNSPYVSGSSNSLFCVQVDNYQKRNYFNNPDLVRSDADFSDYESLYNLPNTNSYSAPTADINVPDGDIYLTGEVILALTILNTSSFLHVPRSALTHECTDFGPVQYLKDEDNTCTRIFRTPLSTLCTTASFLNAENFYRQPLVMNRPNGTEQERLIIDVTGDSLPPSYDNTAGDCRHVVTEVRQFLNHPGVMSEESSAVLYYLLRHNVSSAH